MKILTPQDIESIYSNHVTVNYTDEYKVRYHPLPIERNNRKWRWEGKDFPRVISLFEFDRYVYKYDFKIDNLLLFNGVGDPEMEYLEGRVKSVHDYNYIDNKTKYDLHQLDLDRRDFDFVMFNQTLEHVYNPYLVLKNVYDHMKSGGYLYTNVPACNVPHSEPVHFFTGYTPMGLAATAFQAGFKILEIGQWGSEGYLHALFSRNPGWADYRQFNNPGLNEMQNPVITWGLFKKL